MSTTLKVERNRKVKNITRRIQNRQIFGDKIQSITEIPREVLESVGTDDADTGPSEIESETHLQFIEIIRLLTDLSQQYQTEDYRNCRLIMA